MRYLLLGSIVLLGACVGGKPIHYYAINRLPAGTPVPKPDGLVLLVGRIAVPSTLQEDRIRYRSGNNEVGSYEYHRWTERPAAMVQDLLMAALRMSGKYKQVQEVSSAVTGDYLIRGRLYEFAEIDNPGIQSRVSLRLELVERKTGAVVWEHGYNRDEPVEGKAMAEVVASMEHNLKQVIADAAGAIGAFLAGKG